MNAASESTINRLVKSAVFYPVILGVSMFIWHATVSRVVADVGGGDPVHPGWVAQVVAACLVGVFTSVGWVWAHLVPGRFGLALGVALTVVMSGMFSGLACGVFAIGAAVGAAASDELMGVGSPAFTGLFVLALSGGAIGALMWHHSMEGGSTNELDVDGLAELKRLGEESAAVRSMIAERAHGPWRVSDLQSARRLVEADKRRNIEAELAHLGTWSAPKG